MPNKRKAVFLDRDGTINVEKDYLFRIEDFEFLPGVLDGLQLLRQAGYLLIIITNQSGIARGYYTEEDYNKLTAWMLDQFKQDGIEISKVYHCPHHPRAAVERYRKDCNCRKPGLGLFEKAIKDFDLDLSGCYAIGDKMRDCEICVNSGCHGFVIGSNEDAVTLERIQSGAVRNVSYAKTLYECACIIVAEA